jgi:hypothetical protein
MAVVWWGVRVRRRRRGRMWIRRGVLQRRGPLLQMLVGIFISLYL